MLTHQNTHPLPLSEYVWQGSAAGANFLSKVGLRQPVPPAAHILGTYNQVIPSVILHLPRGLKGFSQAFLPCCPMHLLCHTQKSPARLPCHCSVHPVLEQQRTTSHANRPRKEVLLQHTHRDTQKITAVCLGLMSHSFTTLSSSRMGRP